MNLATVIIVQVLRWDIKVAKLSLHLARINTNSLCNVTMLHKKDMKQSLQCHLCDFVVQEPAVVNELGETEDLFEKVVFRRTRRTASGHNSMSRCYQRKDC